MWRKTNATISPLKKPDALQKALKLLALRDHSEAELLRKLSRYDFPSEAVSAALIRCKEYGYLDDYKFALERARGLMSRGRAIGPKVMEDLRKRGIKEQTARKAIHEASGDINEEELLTAIFEKRFASFSFSEAHDSEKKRVINYLLRRGFSLSTVLEFLREKGLKKNHDDGQ